MSRALLCVVALSACLDNRATRIRGATGLFENVPLYEAPEQSRCERFKKGGSARAACDEAAYLAQIYVRRLSTGDAVCLEGGFGEPPAAACLARGFVADSAPNRVLLEVRIAQPNSKWFDREVHQFWFDEGALVELYLAEHGY